MGRHISDQTASLVYDLIEQVNLSAADPNFLTIAQAIAQAKEELTAPSEVLD